MNEQEQLKEIYDELDKEEQAKKEEYEQLKSEFAMTNKLLDSYGIPRTDNKIKLSLIERVEIAMKQRLFA